MGAKRQMTRALRKRRLKMAKYIKVPPSIRFRNLITRKESDEEEFTFFRWIQGEVLSDTRFGANWKAGRSASQISDAFFDQSPGSWVELESADYDLLKAAAEEPQRYDMATRQPVKGYNPMLLQQIGSYIQAIQDGETNKKPSTDSKESAE